MAVSILILPIKQVSLYSRYHPKIVYKIPVKAERQNLASNLPCAVIPYLAR